MDRARRAIQAAAARAAVVLAILLPAARADAATMSVTPERLLLSSRDGAEAVLRVDLRGPADRPRAGVRWLAETSFGSLSPVREERPGVYSATLSVPPTDMPRTILAVFSPQDDDAAEVAFGLVPVDVLVPLSARTEPNAEVSATVGHRTFGPVRARRDGSFSLDIVLPPGTSSALVLLRDRAGNVTRTELPVPRRHHDVLTVVLDRHRLPSDGTARARVFAFVFDEAGAPVPGARLGARADAGSISDFVDHGDGVHTAHYRPPADGRDGVAELQVSTRHAGQRHVERERVRIVRGRPGRLDLEAEPLRIVAGEPTPVAVVAHVRDSAGNPLSGEDLRLSADRGDLEPVRDAGNGTYRSTLTPPKEVGSGTIEVKAVLAHGEAPSQPARLELSANPDVIPTSWRAFSLVTARVVDERGEPVPGEVVLFHVARGEGTVTPTAVTSQDGRALADFSADPTEEVVTVEAVCTSNPDLRATTTIEKKASGEFAIVSRPAIAAQGGHARGVVVDAGGRVVLHDSVLITILPGVPASLVATATPDELVADGQSTSRIVATLSDARGNPVSDRQLSFAVDRGTVDEGSNIRDGVYAATFTAPAGAGNGRAVVTVREPETGLTARVPVGLRVGPPARLRLAADRTSLPADGASTARLTATVVDATDQPVAGSTVELAVIGGDAAIERGGTTGPDGRVEATLTAGVEAGSVTVEARVPDAGLSAEAELDLTPLGPAELLVLAEPAVILADGQEQAEIRVLLRDPFGNDLVGEMVDLVVTPPTVDLTTRTPTSDASGVARAWLTGPTPGTVEVRATSRSRPHLSESTSVELVRPGLLASFGVQLPACAGAVRLTADWAEAEQWSWDLDGDGSPDRDGREILENLAAGTHEVTLTVTSTEGESSSATQTVVVHGIPLAAILRSAEHAASGQAIALDGSASRAADGGPVTFSWDLDGDGQSDSSEPVVAWSRPDGEWTAVLTVTDDRGCRAISAVRGSFGELADLAVSARVSLPVDPVPVGEVVTYEIRWANEGLREAEGVVVRCTLSEDAVPVAESLPPSTQPAPGRLEFQLGSLAPGASGSFTWQARVRDDLPPGTGTVSLVASIASPSPDAHAGNDADSVLFRWIKKVDVVLSAAERIPAPLAAGGTYGVDLRVETATAHAAMAASLTVTWGEDVLELTNTSPAAVEVGPGWARFDLGELPGAPAPATTASLTWRAFDVLPATENEVQVHASVSHSTVDAAPGDNERTLTPTFSACPNVWVRIVDAEPSSVPLPPGGSIRYRVDCGNDGSTAATDVDLVDLVDDRLITALLENPNDGVFSGDRIEFRLGRLEAGSQRSLVYRVQLASTLPAGTTAVLNAVEASLVELDCDPADDRDDRSVPIDARPVLWVGLSGPAAADAGDQITFQVTLENRGSRGAADVRLTHDLAGADHSWLPASLPAGGALTATGVELAVGELAAGERRTISWAVELADPQAVANPTLAGRLAASGSDAGGDLVSGSVDHDVAITALPDAAVTDISFRPADPRPGDPVELTVTVGVAGSAPAADGAVTLQWNDQEVAGAGLVVPLPTWALGPGTHVLDPVTVTIRPVLPLPVNDVDVTARIGVTPADEQAGNDSLTRSVRVLAAPDLAATLGSLPDPVRAGETVSVTGSVRNDGTTRATQVQAMVVPDAIAFLDPDPVSTSLGTLAADGADVDTTFELTVRDEQPGPSRLACVTLTATGQEAEADTADNAHQRCVTVLAAPDLAVDLSVAAEPSPPTPGGVLSYTVRVTNVGTTRAVAPRLVLTRDEMLLPTLLAPTPAGTREVAGDVTLDLPDLAPASSIVRVFRFQLADTLPGQTTMVEITAAVADAEGLDADAANDRRSLQTPVGAVVDLRVQLSLTPNPADLGAGDTIRVSLHLLNDGSTTAEGVDLSTTFPPGLVSVVAGTLTGGGVPAADGVTWSGFSLAPGAERTDLDYTLRVASPLPATLNPIEVFAEATSDGTELDLLDNTASATLDATAAADPCVSLETVATPSPAEPGGELEYRVTVENLGTTAADPLTTVLDFDAMLLPQLRDAGGATVAGGRLTWNEAALGPGEPPRRHVVRFGIVDPLPAPSQVIHAEASASAPQGPSCTSGPVASDVVLSELPDLATTIDLVASSDTPPSRGSLLTYRIDVRNVGRTDSSDATLSLTLPSQVTMESAAGGAEVSPGIWEWRTGPIATDGLVSVPVSVRVDPTLPAARHVLEAIARVTADGADAFAGNDEGRHRLDIVVDIDLVVQLTCTPAEAPVGAGTSIDHAAVVENRGSLPATDVRLRLEPDPIAPLVGAGPGGPVTILLGTLAPGQSSAPVVVTSQVEDVLPDATNDVTFTATATAAEQDGDPASDSTTCSFTAVAEVDLRVAVGYGGAVELVPGGAVPVTIDVWNAGTQLAPNVAVEIPLAPGLATVTDAGGFTPSPDGLSTTLAQPLSPADGRVTLAFTLRLADVFPGPVTAFQTCATASSPAPERFRDDNTACLTSTIPAAPDLQVSLASTPPGAPAPPGADVPFQLSVTNAGSTRATSASLRVELDPVRMAGVRSALPPGSTVDAAGFTVPLGELAVGSRVDIGFGVALAPLMPEVRSVVTTTACASAAEADVDPASDCATDSFDVLAQPDAWVSFDPVPESGAGAELAVTVRFGNAGTSPVTGARLDLGLDALVTVVDAAGGTPVPGGLRFDPIPDLAPGTGDSRTVRLAVAQVLPDAATTLTLTAGIAHATTADEADATDDTATVTTTARAQADLVAAITRLGPAPTPGGPVTYEVRWENVGGTAARSVSLTVTDSPLVEPPPVPNLVLDLGDVAPGPGGVGTTTLDYVVSGVLPQPRNDLATTVLLASPTPEADPSDDTATATDVIEALPDLRLVLTTTPTPDPAAPGGTLDVVVDYVNAGQTRAEATTLVVSTLDTQVAFVSDPGTGTVAPDLGRVTYDLGVLQPAGSGTVRCTLTIPSVLPSTTNALFVSAEISSAEDDLFPPDNSLVDGRTVVARPDLAMTIRQLSPAGPVVAAGEVVEYEIEVRNVGATTEPAATASVSWDSALASPENDGGGTPGAPGELSWSFGPLDANATVAKVFSLRAAGEQPATSNELIVSAGAAGLASDADPSNNTDSVTTTVTAEPDLVLTTTVAPVTFQAGFSQLTYLYQYSNVGSAPATNVWIRVPYDGSLLRFSGPFGTDTGSRIDIPAGVSIPPGGNSLRLAWFTTVDAPPPPTWREIPQTAWIEQGPPLDRTDDANPADNEDTVTVTGCYIDVEARATRTGFLCLGSHVTLVATTDPDPSQLVFSWTASDPSGNPAGSFSDPTADVTTYTPPPAANAYTITVEVTDLGRNCTVTSQTQVIVSDQCSSCPCGSSPVGITYVNGSLERADDPGSRTVNAGETVAFRVTFREKNNRRKSFLLGGQTTLEFSAGGGPQAPRYSTVLPHDVYVECSSENTVVFGEALVPADMPTGDYLINFRWVTDDTISGPPCGSINTDNEGSNPDRVHVNGLGGNALDPTIEFTAWGPRRLGRPD